MKREKEGEEREKNRRGDKKTKQKRKSQYEGDDEEA